MSEKTFRRRVIGAIARTQAEAAEVLGLSQHAISAWSRRTPESGSMAELLEAVIATMDDEQLSAALTKALEKRSAATQA